MGAKNKSGRIKELLTFSNVLQYSEISSGNSPAGQWHSSLFENERPITLELACGKGEYTLNLATRNPDRNYIGVDIKGPRIWLGAKKALEKNLTNVRFLRAYIDHLEQFFTPGEVDELWITFPDPFIKKMARRSNRLTSPKFLEIYKKVLKPGGVIHLKTDSAILFQFTLDTIEQVNGTLLRRVDDIYQECPQDDLLTIQTFYEKGHRKDGKRIRYLAFRISP